MKNKVFEDFDMLAEYMIDYADEGKVISAVLFYDEAIELMRELLVYEEVEPVLLDISDPKFNGYEQEYYITLTSDYQLCIENAFANGVYLTHEADVVLFDGDVNDKVYQACNSDEFDEINVCEDDICEHCELKDCCSQSPYNKDVELEDDEDDVDDSRIDMSAYIIFK